MHKKIQVVPIREQIAEQLRADVISGALKPGERLREEALSERFGVSRGPIRDVLMQLTKEGILASKRNCGVTVNESLSSDLQGLMIDLRQKIEIHCIQRADQLEEADFEQLESILENLREALEKENFTDATMIDLSFHQYLIECVGGDELVNVWTPIVLRMRMNYQRITSPEQSIKEHQDIIDALRAKDKRAAVAALKANIR